MSAIQDKDYKYALKCIYNAHSSDVRVVKPLSKPCGGVLTGSRDGTAKLWIPDGKYFTESQTFKISSAFVSSLCIFPGSSKYPKGLILAGSNDCAIYGFSLDSPVQVLKLLGHSGPVCSLTYGGADYFVSGSWDKTARIWSQNICTSVLNGHEEAVWATAIFPTQKAILTGSADKTIRLWLPGGQCERIFTGHEDCVRGLAIISETKFVSCANDNTVRIWLTNGECTGILKDHSDYIYSITLLDNGIDFATCGEDQKIKIWKDGICAQTVVLPSKSLWSVACLSNGDLAIGTSDGKVYVLEKVPVDYFESRASVANKEHHSNPPSTGIAGETITSEDSDNRSCIYNGERVVFYEELNNMMYVCEYNNESGTKVKKEVLDFQFISDTFYKKPPEDSTQLPKDAKENTIEIDIDIQGTKYKLSFNKGDNPWEVASRFVSNHDLLTEHVGQIVDFILKNTDCSFSNEYFPVRNYTTYLNVYIDGLRTKLLEFSEKVGKENCISPSEINELVKLADNPDMVSVEQLSSLDKAIHWNDEFLYPVLDLIRICVKCKALHGKMSSKEFMNCLLHIFMDTGKSINRVLIAKIMCNMFGILDMEDLLAHYQERIYELVKEVASLKEESIQRSCSTLFLNFAVASLKGFKLDAYSFCLNVIAILDAFVDQAAIFRLLLAIGTVCTCNSLAVSFFSAMDLKNHLLKYECYQGNFKIGNVAKLLRSNL